MGPAARLVPPAKGMGENLPAPGGLVRDGTRLFPLLASWVRRLDAGVVRLENGVPQRHVRFGRVADGPQQGERAPLAVHGVGTRRKRDVPARAAPPLPHREANQLEPFERSFREVQFGVRELASRVAFVIEYDLDRHDVVSFLFSAISTD